MIISLKQKKRKCEPRIKLNHPLVPTGKNDVHVRMLQMNSLLGLKAELIPIWLLAFFYGTVFAIGCINKKNGVIPFHSNYC